ncbi:hypothetical protein ACFPU1_13290 [Thalassorhabdus alkalitolerans]|uniref:Uncharacterized protein n=1 Tax=Thalassorhabdus alkalitolerans TaxID=2282697 RepID=A0ABW0YT57_9BACI
MQRAKTTSKDGCLREGTLEAKSNAGVCSVLRGWVAYHGGSQDEELRS